MKGVKNVVKNRVLFCNIAYMKYYSGITETDTPINGGRYVNEENDAMEKYNFLVCSDGLCRGFVETSHSNGYKAKYSKPRRIRIERIDGEFKNKEAVDGVTVIFFAKAPKGEHIVVGWYENATVYRERRRYQGREYNITAKAIGCKLIDWKNRNYVVPKGPMQKKKYGVGAGQSNIWYADKTQLDKEFVKKTLEYINNLSV